MAFWHRSLALLSIGMVVASGCGGGGGGGTTPTPTPVTVTSVVVSGAGSPVIGDTVQLTAAASFSDGTTQNVTAQVTWETSNQAIVTITSGGLATFLAQGDADMKATYKGVAGTSHVTVSSKAVQKFTLSGLVTDAINGKPLADATVTILDGADAGRSAASDATGKYAIANVTGGTFNVQFSRKDYESKTIQVVLTADASYSVPIKSVANVTAFYGTYNTALTIQQQSCDFPFSVGPSGTFKLEGAVDGTSILVTIVERGTTRTYNGTMSANGQFSGSGGGIIAGFTPPKNSHEYNGGVSGTTDGRNLNAVENIVFTIPCPGATMKIGYIGNK